MNNRVPDGLGGNYTFLMQGKPDNGYFHNLVAAAGTEDTSETVIEDFDDTEWYDYPTRENSLGVAGAEFNYVETKDAQNITREGFEVNPQENWKEYIITLGTQTFNTGHYTTLDKYPGLTKFTLEKIGRNLFPDWLVSLAGIFNVNVDDWLIDAYKPTTTPLSQTQIKR